MVGDGGTKRGTYRHHRFQHRLRQHGALWLKLFHPSLCFSIQHTDAGNNLYKGLAAHGSMTTPPSSDSSPDDRAHCNNETSRQITHRPIWYSYHFYRYFPGTYSRLNLFTADAEKMSYTFLFSCKHLIRKVKRVRLGTRKANSVRLPQEIVDYIVDYVSDDRPTLFACTHLSRAWCIAARTHLYRTLTVSDLTGFKATNDLQKMGMVHLVHRMVVIRKINQVDFMLSKTLTRLNPFTHLQELDLRYLNVGELVLQLYEGCDTLKSTVRTLELRHPAGGIKHIVCFISLFSNLENLTVDGINRIISDSPIPVVEYSPPLTGRLKLSGISDQDFIHDLVSMRGGVRFRTVDLRFCREVQEIIDGCAATMERLIWHSSDFIGGYIFAFHNGRF